MSSSRFKYFIAYVAIQILSHFIAVEQANSQLVTHKIQLKNDHKQSGAADQGGVEDILRDTFGLLDVLDQKLAAVKNRTAIANMRDNLRSRDFKPLLSPRLDEAAVDDDETLLKVASNFASDRRSDQLESAASGGRDPMLMAASEQQAATVDLAPKTSDVTMDPEALVDAFKRSRQLVPDDYNHDIQSDPTDKHLKFTLDLMQSIFKSQSYNSETNAIESFLISPLSVQMVLMMMHLGARGQTRREIGNCLHLGPQFDADEKLASPKVNPVAQHQPDNLMKLKRRQSQQQQPQASGDSSSNKRNFQPSGPTLAPMTTNGHELFGTAMRNLLKDPVVMKALSSANQILLQRNLPLSPQFSWAIKHYYGAEIKQVDFRHQSSERTDSTAANPPSHSNQHGEQRAKLSPPSSGATDESSPSQNIQQMVNDWVERQSKGRITNFLTSPVSTSTLMMAINVLFFKGDWQYKFDPADTQTDASFTQANGKTVKVPMMVSKLPLAFAHDPAMKTSVIELPYKAQRLGLFVLLPDEVSGIFHTMQMLNSTSFANLISSMRRPAPGSSADLASNGINVRIPKFSIESSPRLSQILSQYLGVKSLFMPDIADLSGMFSPPTSAGTSGPKRRATSGSPASNSSSVGGKSTEIPLQVGLDELLHKAVLQVDEQGSVASASSAAIVERVGLFNSNYFEADHPFLLFLMDKQTGLVLFSGAFAGDKGVGSPQAPSSSQNSSAAAPTSLLSSNSQSAMNSNNSSTTPNGGNNNSGSNNSRHSIS